MTIKKYFEVAENIQSLANKSAADIGSEVESVGYHEQDIIEEERFIPRVDFSKPENFARYGSAEEYYDSSLRRIYNTYPYDGSLQERLKWVNASTYLDLYIYDEKYPRTTGYVIMSAEGSATTQVIDGYGRPSTQEFIYVKGGPNTNPNGMENLAVGFTGSNYYEPSMRRTSNLAFDLASHGASVEFWLKKDTFLDPATSSREVIFDMWNGEISSSATYARLRLELTGNLSDGSDPFLLTVMSGNAGIYRQPIGSATVTSASVADGRWHHYAVTLRSASAGIKTRFYVDGGLDGDQTLGSAGINDIAIPGLQAYLGALIAPVSGTATPSATKAGDGKLAASLDEFRYWKTQRSSKDIGRYWFTQVGGGVNTDPQPFIETAESGNVDLGVYYKFNEGITGVAATDSVVLDYSGRISNGSWTGYSAGSRNTGSAIVSSSAAIKEFRDPIIYSFHPEVVALASSLKTSGSAYDGINNAAVYNSIPAWITEEDQEGEGNLRYLTQIMSSYFDTLQLQIESLNTLQDVQYPSGSNKPLPFAQNLLAAKGLVAPEIFLDADILERLADRSEDKVYEQTLADTKNIIYQNLYNNLSYLYKTKGTIKAFRNILRCFGIDDELVKFNMYANNIEYELRNNRRNVVEADNYVDFNTTPGNNATVYNYADPLNTNSVGFIASNTHLTGGYALTMETEILFPKKVDQASIAYINTNVISASLFGVHGALTTAADTTWPTLDGTNFQVYAERDELQSSNVRFVLTGSTGGYVPRLVSDLYQEVYDNTRWNLSVRIKPLTFPFKGMPTGSAPAPASAVNNDYVIELHGVHADSGVILDEFTVSGTILAPPVGFMTGSRRAYIGAHRQNFTGSVLASSDVKVNAARYWLDYVEDEALRGHALDSQNHGALQPHLYAFPFNPSASFGEITKFDTLVFNWEFLNNTGSNASGQFSVTDLSSGSASPSRFGALGNILNKQYTGLGNYFSPSSTTAIDKDFIVSSKLNLPEQLYGEEMVRTLGAQELHALTSDSRPVNYSFAFEKSMYQVISEEMVNYFATLKDFNNLIGDPVERYRTDYKKLSFMRQKFFESIENPVLDFDKFYEFYKWFDSSLSVILSQFVPASADVTDSILTVIENHILERPKYRHKFPFLEKIGGDEIGSSVTNITSPPPPTPPAQPGFNNSQDLTYRQIGSSNPPSMRSWQYLHAPIGPGSENNNLYWHRYRAEASTSDLDAITSVIQERFHRGNQSNARLSMRAQLELGGVSRHPNNRPNYVFAATAPFGPTVPGTAQIPQNIMVGLGTEVEQLIETNDQFYPSSSYKQRLGFSLDPGINRGASDDQKQDGNNYAPFSLYSSSVKTGYNEAVVTQYRSGTLITNLHDDFVLGHDKPLQGPFSEKFVGGRFYRHTPINSGDDTVLSRAEGFRIQFTGVTSSAGTVFADSLAIIPANSTGGAPVPQIPTAFRMREETAKRPVNIKNILMTTASMGVTLSGTIAHDRIGNYQKNYQVISTNGRTTNDPFFNDQSFDFALYPETLATRGKFPLDATSTANPGGEIDYALPNRTGANSNQTIIVNRFSSPGEYSTLSRGYMEPAHEELSVNNAGPYRNQRVINFGFPGSASMDPSIQNTIRVVDQIQKNRGLNQLSTLHAGKFGMDAAYGTLATIAQFPSWHKTNRNPRRRIIQTGEQFAGPGKGYIAVYATGTVYDNLYVQHAIPRSTQQYSWVTGSMISGTAILGLQPPSFNSASTLSQIVISGTYPGSNFVGIRNRILDPVTASSHILGFPLSSVASSSYYNSTLGLGLSNGADYFNVLMNNRGNVYGTPSWKQIRTSEHPIVRQLRQTNKIGATLVPPKIPNIIGGNTIGFIQPQNPNAFIDYYEPPISNNSSPIQFYFEDNTANSNPANNMVVSVPFHASLEHFNHRGLNQLLGINTEFNTASPYKQVASYTLYSPLSVAVNYSQRVYPSALNVYKAAIRSRTRFTITNIWDDSRDKRSLTYGGQLGSMGQTVAYESTWPMDGHLNFTTSASTNLNDGAGELLNAYSRYSGYSLEGDRTAIIAAPTYAMRLPLGEDPVSEFPVFVGDAQWLAGSQSGKSPYSNYVSYAEKMRAHGKDYSIVPEFRMSGLIETYINTYEGDFQASLDNILELTGSSLSSSAQDGFYRIYTNGDFLKYFSVIDNDLNEQRSGDLKIIRDKIALKCDALVKFLPYKGFYPAERTAVIAQLLSQSYGSSINANAESLRILLEPMVSPGILYNTIKSGIAVSNFVLANTSSSPDFMNRPPASGPPSNLFTYSDEREKTIAIPYTIPLNVPLDDTDAAGGYVPNKIPFEALYKPESFFNNTVLQQLPLGGALSTKLYDTGTKDSAAEPTPYPSGQNSSIDFVSFQGDQLYKLAMDNFLCETTNMFMGRLTNFQSAREESFQPVRSGSTYSMQLKLFRTPIPSNAKQGPDTERFTLYDNSLAFGQPLVAKPTSANGLSMTHVTPPYYGAAAYCKFEYTATWSGIPSLQEIFANTTMTFTRNSMNGTTDASTSPMQMNIDSCFNLTDTLETVPAGTVEQKDRWLIQSKFETPALNFAHVSASVPPESTVLAGIGAEEFKVKGMWHQYGQIPEDSKDGIFAVVSAGSGSIQGDLAQIIGMPTGIPKRIGTLQPGFTMSEALVAIPFRNKDNERQFIAMPPGAKDTATYEKAVNALNKYVFPPKFDFVEFDSVLPIMMYVFEYSVNLTQQDLVDIWQGLPPKIGEKFQTQEAYVEEKELIDLLIAENSPVQWMVFKVKQRAKKDFETYRRSLVSENTDSITPNITSPYSYNWPYDFCSLVELAKINEQVQYVSTDLKQNTNISTNESLDVDRTEN